MANYWFIEDYGKGPWDGERGLTEEARRIRGMKSSRNLPRQVGTTDRHSSDVSVSKDSNPES